MRSLSHDLMLSGLQSPLNMNLRVIAHINTTNNRKMIINLLYKEDNKSTVQRRRGHLLAEGRQLHSHELLAELVAQGLRQAAQQLHRHAARLLVVVVLGEGDHWHEHLVTTVPRPQVRRQGHEGLHGAAGDLTKLTPTAINVRRGKGN